MKAFGGSYTGNFLAIFTFPCYGRFKALREFDMTKRTYSPHTLKVLEILGKMIQMKRKESGMTLQGLADRAGVSRSLVQRLEKCDPGCEIGVAFEVAHLLGIQLFDSRMGHDALSDKLSDKIALLPASIRENKIEVSNEF